MPKFAPGRLTRHAELYYIASTLVQSQFCQGSKALAMQIRISGSDGVPIYRQIVNQVKYLVAVGRMSVGEQLPTVRALAEQLVVNPNTVARAYRELESAGVIASRQGSGAFVAGNGSPLARATSKNCCRKGSTSCWPRPAISTSTCRPSSKWCVTAAAKSNRSNAMSPVVPPNIAPSPNASSTTAPSGAIVDVAHLSRSFGKKQALVDVTQRIERGTVFGLVGENGAGKTTLIKHLLGLLKPTHGSVHVFGLDPVSNPVGVLGRIGYLSEDRDMPDWMTVAQLMRYNQAFFPGWDERFADQLRDQFELDPKQQIKRLSRGQRARAGLLIALAHRPDLLILDEPSSGLDPVVRNDILSAIIRSVADEGRTVIFSSHLLDEVQRVADWVMLLDHGRVALSAPLHEILHSHKRLVLRFAAPQQTRPDLPGMLSSQGEGHEWTILCNGGLEELRVAAARAGAEVLEEETPSLDEIFLARAKTPHV